MSVQLMPLTALAAQITSCNSYEAFDYLIVDDVMTYEKKIYINSRFCILVIVNRNSPLFIVKCSITGICTCKRYKNQNKYSIHTRRIKNRSSIALSMNMKK
jgi:hypothetical protein